MARPRGTLALWLAVAVAGSLVRRSRAGGIRLAGWVRRRRYATVRTRSVQGAMLLAEQRWRDAEQVLLEAAEKGDAALADYLGAARAANAGDRFEQRDRILDQAKAALPEAAFAVDLIRSELQQQGGHGGKRRDAGDLAQPGPTTSGRPHAPFRKPHGRSRTGRRSPTSRPRCRRRRPGLDARSSGGLAYPPREFPAQ